MKLSNVEISLHIIILKRFDQHNKVILFIVTVFVASCQTLDASQKLRVQLSPLLRRRTVTEEGNVSLLVY